MVPNIRPVPISSSDCGDVSEVDYADGEESGDEVVQRFLGGTPYRVSAAYFWRLEIRGVDVFSFGRACNAEFRRRFATALAATVRQEDLRDAWRFLGARLRPSYANGGLSGGRNRYERLVAFTGRKRAPPVQWTLSHFSLSREVTRYIRKEPAGRAVDAAAARFWSQEAQLLEDDIRACPGTVARLQAARTEVQAFLQKEQGARED